MASLTFSYRVLSLSLGLLLLGAACGGGGGSDGGIRPDAGPPGNPATAVFVPPAPGSGSDWGKIPYPSDLFLDADGKLTLNSLPNGSGARPEVVDLLQAALHTLDGPGITTNVYFPIDGDLDPASLAGNVVLVDMEGGFLPVEADLVWRPDLSAIVLAPRRGTLLVQGAQYGAYVTRGVQSADGLPLEASSAYLAAADLQNPPSDPALLAAQQSLAPLLSQLDDEIVPEIVAATVFTTTRITDQMVAVRDAIYAAPPSLVQVDDVVSGAELDALMGTPMPSDPPGYDVAEPQPQHHDRIRAVVQMTLEMPNFISDRLDGAGKMVFDPGTGAAQVKGRVNVPVTLVLPDAADCANLPVVLFGHGVGRTRADVLVTANILASKGIASLSVDLPFHGDRQVGGAQDMLNRFTGDMTPDGFGDANFLLQPINFFHLNPRDGLPGKDQIVMRDHLRQAGADFVSLTAWVGQNETAPIVTALAGEVPPVVCPNLSLRSDVGVLSHSFGSMLTALAVGVDPNIKIATHSVIPVGFPWPGLLNSGGFTDLFQGFITIDFDISTQVTLGDPTLDARFHPIVSLFNQVMEGGDPQGYAGTLYDGPVRGDAGPHLLILEAYEDEVVWNGATEHYAALLGVPRMLMNLATEPPGGLRYVPLTEVSAPVSLNMEQGTLTGALTLWHRAGHRLIDSHRDDNLFEPNFPPFVELAEPMFFQNPIREAHQQVADFLSSYFSGGAPTISDPFAN